MHLKVSTMNDCRIYISVFRYFFHLPLHHWTLDIHLLSAVLVLRPKVHAFAAVPFALLIVGFLGVGVISFAVAEAPYRAGQPLLQCVPSGSRAFGSRRAGGQRAHRWLRLQRRH